MATERMTFSKLCNMVDRLNTAYGTNYSIRGAYGLVGIDNQNGSHHVTGLMKSGELAVFIDGLRTGLESK